ncbi:hypothetical protein FRC17_003396 [Serendipita sp. 399]|nr:hypothetical protein FRC17_003396 [Serendipita sp. 399]
MPTEAAIPTLTRRKSRDHHQGPKSAAQPEHDDQAETSLAPWWNLDAIISANTNSTPFRKQKYDALKWLNEELLLDEDGAEFLVDDHFATPGPGYQSSKRTTSTKRRRSSMGNSHLRSSSRRTSVVKQRDLTLADLTPRSRRVSAIVRSSATPRRSDFNLSKRPPVSSAKRKSFTPRAQLAAIQESSPHFDKTPNLQGIAPSHISPSKPTTSITPLVCLSEHVQRKGGTPRTTSHQKSRPSTGGTPILTLQSRRKSKGRNEASSIAPQLDESDDELHRSIPGAFDFVPASHRRSSAKVDPVSLLPPFEIGVIPISRNQLPKAPSTDRKEPSENAHPSNSALVPYSPINAQMPSTSRRTTLHLPDTHMIRPAEVPQDRREAVGEEADPVVGFGQHDGPRRSLPRVGTPYTPENVDLQLRAHPQPSQQPLELLASPTTDREVPSKKMRSPVTKHPSKKRPLESSPNKPNVRASKRQHIDRTTSVPQREEAFQLPDRRKTLKVGLLKNDPMAPKRSEHAPTNTLHESRLQPAVDIMPPSSPPIGRKQFLSPPRRETQAHHLPEEETSSLAHRPERHVRSLRSSKAGELLAVRDQEDVFGKVMENSIDMATDDRSWMLRRNLPVEVFESADIPVVQSRETTQVLRPTSQVTTQRETETFTRPTLPEASGVFDARSRRESPRLAPSWRPPSPRYGRQADKCSLTMPVSPKFVLGQRERQLQKAEKQKSRDEHLVKLRRAPPRGEDRPIPPVAAKLLATLAGLQVDLKAPTHSSKPLPSQEFTFVSELRPRMGLQGAKEAEQAHKEQFAARRSAWEQRSLASTESSNDQQDLASRSRALRTDTSTHLHYRSTVSAAAKAVAPQHRAISRHAHTSREPTFLKR